jgi:hypothetical protein
MQAKDPIIEWLVQWEEAYLAHQPPPAVNDLPAELRPRAREGLRLLRCFARMSHGLTTTPSAPPLVPPLQPPNTPRYRFLVLLAQGGMGEVWRGLDMRLERGVALKVLPEHAFAEAGSRACFEEEARFVSQLEHPSIVPVYDLGELPDGRPFFVMKLIHGQSLAAVLAARSTLDEDLSSWVEVFGQVCAAVAFAHSRELIHRDLKPSNVMLGDFGEVLVVDWGIAKALAGRPPAQLAPPAVPSPPTIGGAKTVSRRPDTQPGEAKGTPAFMAPEQARGEASRVGKASDVFGLGGILSVILTGQPPYTAVQQVLEADVTEAFARLDGCGADAELIELAKACLAPAAEARPANAGEVARRVKCYCEQAAARQAQAERVLWLRDVAEQTERAGWQGPVTFPAAAEEARVRLRQQAWALLRAEVARQAQQLSSANPAEASAARQVLESLCDFPALAGVHHPAALADLPESERQMWQTFWQEIEGLLRGPIPAQ